MQTGSRPRWLACAHSLCPDLQLHQQFPVDHIDSAAVVDAMRQASLDWPGRLRAYCELLADSPPPLQDAVLASPDFWSTLLGLGAAAQAEVARADQLLALLLSVRLDIQAGRSPRLLAELTSRQAWGTLVQAVADGMFIQEQQGLAAELLLTVCAEASRAPAQAGQDAPGGQVNSEGAPGCDAAQPCVPPQLAALTAELELLTNRTVTATAAQLKACTAHTLHPYRLFTTQIDTTSAETVHTAFTAHHAAEQQSAEIALKHAGTAIRLLGLTNLLLMHYGPSPTASVPLQELASALLSLLPTTVLSGCALPAKPEIQATSQQPPGSTTAAAGGIGVQAVHHWQVQQYTAAKQRRRVIKLLVNDALSCLEVLMDSDAGWKAVSEVPNAQGRPTKAAAKPPTVHHLDTASQIYRLTALVTLVNRPTFQASTVAGALHCLVMATLRLDPSAVAALATHVPGAPDARQALLVRLLTLLQDNNTVTHPQLLRPCLLMMYNILDVLTESPSGTEADQPQSITDHRTALTAAMTAASSPLGDVLSRVSGALTQQLEGLSNMPVVDGATQDPQSPDQQAARVDALHEIMQLAEGVRQSLSSFCTQQEHHRQPGRVNGPVPTQHQLLVALLQRVTGAGMPAGAGTSQPAAGTVKAVQKPGAAKAVERPGTVKASQQSGAAQAIQGGTAKAVPSGQAKGPQVQAVPATTPGTTPGSASPPAPAPAPATMGSDTSGDSLALGGVHPRQDIALSPSLDLGGTGGKASQPSAAAQQQPSGAGASAGAGAGAGAGAAQERPAPAKRQLRSQQAPGISSTQPASNTRPSSQQPIPVGTSQQKGRSEGPVSTSQTRPSGTSAPSAAAGASSGSGGGMAPRQLVGRQMIVPFSVWKDWAPSKGEKRPPDGGFRAKVTKVSGDKVSIRVYSVHKDGRDGAVDAWFIKEAVMSWLQPKENDVTQKEYTESLWGKK